MNQLAIAHRRLIACAAMIVLVLVALRTPVVPSIVLGGVAECVGIAERIARFRCWLLYREDCFSLDRFDPTCPQCM
ncbi:MAG TPA: hypothetical protein VGI45_31970 [Terracidiphilus sp.]